MPTPPLDPIDFSDAALRATLSLAGKQGNTLLLRHFLGVDASQNEHRAREDPAGRELQAHVERLRLAEERGFIEGLAIGPNGRSYAYDYSKCRFKRLTPAGYQFVQGVSHTDSAANPALVNGGETVGSMPDDLISQKEAAAAAGVRTAKTIRDWIAVGKLKGHGVKRQVSRSELARYLDEREKLKPKRSGQKKRS